MTKRPAAPPNSWGRAMGWVPVALLDELDFIPADHPDRAKLEKMAVDLLKSLLAFQSEDGRWYQVDQPGRCIPPTGWRILAAACM
ncbi:MAG: glycoside hydrolase family 88 protein [Oscillibacter sp.]